jgi:hypothetical protein
MPPPVPPIPPIQPGIPAINPMDLLKRKAIDNARKALLSRLGAAPGQALPADVEQSISQTVEKRFKLNVERRAIDAAVIATLNEGEFKPALQKLNQIQATTLSMTELKDALKKNSDLLFMTYKAFMDAGFTGDQAFQIVLTQVAKR